MSGFTNLSVVNAITQFVNGTQASWDAITVPIPKGLVIYATDTTVVKMGDGVTLYAQLPVLFTISQIAAMGSGGSGSAGAFSNTAALRAASAGTVNNQLAEVLGETTIGDGSGDSFYWSTTSTLPDDNLSVIQPTATTGPGRWLVYRRANYDSTESYTVLNQSVAGGMNAQMLVQVYYPAPGETDDITITSLVISVTTGSGQNYNFRWWNESPNGTGPQILWDFMYSTFNQVIYENPFYFIESCNFVYTGVPNAIYLQVINKAANAFDFGVQIKFTRRKSVIVPALPIFVPLPPYTGPRLMAVHVGPTLNNYSIGEFPNMVIGITALADGGIMTVDAGVYFDVFTIPPGWFTNPSTLLQGAGAYATVCNGRGGAGAGYRLSWGKGFIHTNSPVTIEGFSFINCGGADNIGDGEAGIYAEFFTVSSTDATLVPGTVTINNCAFDGNENGIFIPSYLNSGTMGGLNITININNCDFGLYQSNGQSRDGLSHDYYIQCSTLNETNCHHYGNWNANNAKTRAGVATFTNGYNAAANGRCINAPNAGQLTISGGTYTSIAPANTDFMTYGDENQLGGVYTPTANGCTVIGTRYDSVFFIGAAVAYTFTNTTQQWYTFLNYVGPSFGMDPGSVAGSSFVGLFTSPGAGGTVLTSAPIVPLSVAWTGTGTPAANALPSLITYTGAGLGGNTVGGAWAMVY